MWNLLQSLWARKERAARVYGCVVAQARKPAFYTHLGLPDTPEGRYEAIAIHLVLVIARLTAIGPAGHRLARRVNEAFVTDMDDNLREMGVGDLTVPKKVKRAAAGLIERSQSYGAAMASGETGVLASALGDQMGSAAPGQEQLMALARYMCEVERALAAAPDAGLMAGGIEFPVVC